MSDLVIDTHIAIWALTEPQMLSATAKPALVAAETNGVIYVSAVTLIELIYLTEKGKVLPDALNLLRTSLDDPTTAFQLVEIDRAVANAVGQIPRAIVPDMPDRIIAATALHLNLPLVTADHQIQAAGIQTIW
jgi:PIN domain nuclease of toxin-antitoxin system